MLDPAASSGLTRTKNLTQLAHDSHSESFAKILGRKTPIFSSGDNFESENETSLAENWPESLKVAPPLRKPESVFSLVLF